MNKITYLLDLDDTLYCEHYYVKSGFRVVANYLSENSNYQEKDIFEKMIYFWMKDGRGKVFNNVCDFLKINTDIRELVKLYRRHFPAIHLYDDAKSFTAYANRNNMRLGIITDGNSLMQWNKIKALNLEEMVDVVVVCDDLGGARYWKPSKVPYLTATKKIGVSPKECCYVGDNPKKDFITARKLGMETIRIKRQVGDHMKTNVEKKYEADRVITSLTELIESS